MTEVLTERAEDIFYSALEIKSPDERKAFLDRACQGDAALRSMVEKLLASQPEAEKFFQEGGVVRLPMEELSHHSRTRKAWLDPLRGPSRMRPLESPLAITRFFNESVKAAAAWSIWPNRRSRSVAGWRSRSSSSAWTPKVSSPVSKPNDRRWR